VRRTSGDLLAELFVAYGVRYVFGIPGGQTQPLYDALSRRGDQIRHILVRDERSGPYAADAYARVTGRLAVCDAVPGPGVVKLPSGLSEALASSVPLVAIAGDIPQPWRHLARYACAAQGLDQIRLLEPVSKSVINVPSQAVLPSAVRHAFVEATTGRPGPVVLNIPADVFHEAWDSASLPPEADPRFAEFPALRPHPPADAVAAAARMLAEAQRPVLVVGGGGLHSRAFEPVRRLAERLTLPVATTVSGKGIIAESHPLCIGVLGGQYGEDSANQIVREADVVFLVGFKSSQQSTFEWTLPAPTQRTIHLDIDPYEIGKVFHTTIPLVGDAATGLSDLLAYVERGGLQNPHRAEWRRRIDEAKRNWTAQIIAELRATKPILPQYVMHELQRQTRPGDIVVSDASFSIGWITSYYDLQKEGRQCLFPRGSATLGYGLPAAIGAKLATPHARVVCVAGDGGIAYALGELATCRKYDLAIVVVVLNNGCLAYSKWGEYKGEGHYENVDFPDTNFALIARAFGCVGLRVEAPDELSDALAQALQSDAPTLIDVVVDPWATPELRLRRERRPVASTA
jgi:acetolactate synthase-1/2/3 large subunit